MINDLKAAEEYLGQYGLSPGWAQTAQHIFLAGVIYARTPIKIDPDNEETWPSETDKQYLLWDRERYWTLFDSCHYTSFDLGIYTHWIPLPL